MPQVARPAVIYPTRYGDIVTINIYPPIPCRQFDWLAYIDGQEERREYGYGPNEAEAIADLVNNYLQQE